MKVTFDLDEETDGKELILMMAKAGEAFSLLHEIDEKIRSLLKYRALRWDEGEASDVQKVDVLVKKNDDLIEFLEELRVDLRELQL